MHAILGYAASELMVTDSSLAPVAMNHRIKAIKAIKKRLTDASKMETTYEEANALVATCFALTFQSVSLEDGLAEYMTFIRGIVIVGMQMMFKSIKPLFSNLFESNQDEVMAPYMEGLPLIEKGWAEAAVESITNLGPLCTRQVEIEYHEQLLNVASQLLTNSFEGTLTSIFTLVLAISLTCWVLLRFFLLQHTRPIRGNTDGGCCYPMIHFRNSSTPTIRSSFCCTRTG
jgi:hypothetical protein